MAGLREIDKTDAARRQASTDIGQGPCATVTVSITLLAIADAFGAIIKAPILTFSLDLENSQIDCCSS
jgi:hypothetical protein